MYELENPKRMNRKKHLNRLAGTRVLRRFAILALFLLSALAHANDLPRKGKLLLKNDGGPQSEVGPEKLGDAQVGGDNFGMSFFDTTPAANKSYGSLGFPADAYDPAGSVIEFDYSPSSPEGNIIFVIGGDPSSGIEENMVALYKRFYDDKHLPTFTASTFSNSWGYTVRPEESEWYWEVGKWYHIEVEFRATNDSSDFLKIWVDGRLFGLYNGDEERPISASLKGPIWFGGYLEVSYANTPARFSNLRIYSRKPDVAK